MSPTASVNSLAMVAEIVVPGARIEAETRVGVADDEGHRHGFAERAAKPQHDAADDADPRVGQHHVARHLPGGAAEAVGAPPSAPAAPPRTRRARSR